MSDMRTKGYVLLAFVAVAGAFWNATLLGLVNIQSFFDVIYSMGIVVGIIVFMYAMYKAIHREEQGSDLNDPRL